MSELITTLRGHGIQTTPQRVAVANYVLTTTSHPTADQVWARVRGRCPSLSRATVYNTLHLLVEKGLLKPHAIREGVVVFDAHVERHHHLIDEETGEIHDVPWKSLAVWGAGALAGYDVRDYHVVMRGRRRRT